ncbi:MAG TPA: hypothetical protein VLA19_03680 [Herpetosiphonaceae bacterium]|nr:hypothetical protein [Herpetosiphonaceae bacterium]
MKSMLSLSEKMVILRSVPFFAETPDDIPAEVAARLEEVVFGEMAVLDPEPRSNVLSDQAAYHCQPGRMKVIKTILHPIYRAQGA